VNSLLLTLTALLILVLSALFAAPLFIDWNDYRSVFETQATNLLGRQVKVGGKVHLVLLPAPELKFDDIKVADQEGRLDRPFLEMRSLEAWLNIGALLTGTVEARRMYAPTAAPRARRGALSKECCRSCQHQRRQVGSPNSAASPENPAVRQRQCGPNKVTVSPGAASWIRPAPTLMGCSASARLTATLSSAMAASPGSAPRQPMTARLSCARRTLLRTAATIRRRTPRRSISRPA
jgi:hypothetical protein